MESNTLLSRREGIQNHARQAHRAEAGMWGTSARASLERATYHASLSLVLVVTIPTTFLEENY